MAREATIRTLAVLRRLEGRRCGLSVTELAEAFEVHRRTIARDLAALEAAGFPLVEVEGRWHLFTWGREAA